MSHFIYIVRCADGTLYTGYTTDVVKRVKEHNGKGVGSGLSAGAKYTRSRQPVTLMYSETLPTRSDAQRREYEIKQLNRTQKQALIATKKKLKASEL